MKSEGKLVAWPLGEGTKADWDLRFVLSRVVDDHSYAAGRPTGNRKVVDGAFAGDRTALRS